MPQEAVGLLETMQPGFKRTQLEGSFRRTVRPKFVKVITGPVAPEVAAALAAQPAVTHDLATFQLHPPGLKGLALFEHMCEFRKRHSPQDEPRPSLDVVMMADQKVIIAPTMADLVVGQILKDAGGDGAT